MALRAWVDALVCSGHYAGGGAVATKGKFAVVWVAFVVLGALFLGGCGRAVGRIDKITPEDGTQPLKVEAGKPALLRLTFTNVGSRPGTFIARVVVYTSGGQKVREYEKPPVLLSPGQQETVEWEHVPSAEGEYAVQFSLWKDTSTVVAQRPDKPQKLLLVTAATPTGKFALGDRVRVISAVNVRTAPGTSNPKVTHVNYPGSMPMGSQGKITAGPQQADGYLWWRVEYDNGVTGWCIEEALAKATK